MALAPSLWWLFVGRIVAGITSASATAAGAYIADVMPPEERAAAFGMSARRSAWDSCSVRRSADCCGEIDPRLPFWAAGALQPR